MSATDSSKLCQKTALVLKESCFMALLGGIIIIQLADIIIIIMQTLP